HPGLIPRLGIAVASAASPCGDHPGDPRSVPPDRFGGRPRLTAESVGVPRYCPERFSMATSVSSIQSLDFEAHRRELTAFCYRMLGSSFDAEDAVQETLTRAWKAFDRFEGRSSVRTWLYRIASNVCFDRRRAANRRARPVDRGEPGTVAGPRGEPLASSMWVEPIPDARALASDDPAEQAGERDSIRLAFIAALQVLPPRQRAALILKEVLALSAQEIAELLDTSVAAVNSALQRARATLADRGLEDTTVPEHSPDQELLARYMAAFE